MGTIIFKLCDFPSTITPVSITSGASIIIQGGGLNVYNYYTISRTTQDGGSQIIYHDFIVMNIKELDKPNSFLMIGKFKYQGTNQGTEIIKCPCDTLPEEAVRAGKYSLVNRNNRWHSDMTFGEYDYNLNKDEGTIKSFGIKPPGEFTSACQSI